MANKPNADKRFISISTTFEIAEKLNAEAKRCGVSRNQLVNQILEERVKSVQLPTETCERIAKAREAAMNNRLFVWVEDENGRHGVAK